MSKTSRLTFIAALAAAAVAVPTFSQTAAARPAARHHPVDPHHRRLYNYVPGGLSSYLPGPAIVSPFGDNPAAAGGGSSGYNAGTLQDY